MSLTRTLFKLARISAWSRATVRLAQGKPHAFVTRARNRSIYRLLGRILRK